MKIKMRVHFAGPGFSAGPGDEIERPDDEALRLIQKGYAAAMSAFPERETAVPKPVVETRDPFDHDGDGKPGGSLPKSKRGRRR